MSENNRKAMLEYLSSTATANCEADVESFLKIFNPAPTRTEMGEIFKENLGYNPITHYDMQDVLAAFDEVVNSNEISSDGISIIVKKKDEIVEKAMAIFETRRDGYLRECLALAMADYLGNDDSDAVSMYLVGDKSATNIVDIDDDDGDGDDEIGADMSDLDEDERPDLLPLDSIDDSEEGPEFTFNDDEDSDED